ncbi:MAG TPA: TylF/MycF/NovP-related O-methyltransferase [Gemmatimonadaceae bacterium]|nr:TylF/MycF/NovP-related O-methyltransferase [Gemmatimonadaceae bacterium]
MRRLPRGARVWLDNQRQARRVRQGHASFDRARLTRTYEQCLRLLLRREPAAELGDYLEFGVLHGASLSCMYAAREAVGLDHVRLFGFDSFEGLPESAAREDDGFWAPGQFRSSSTLTRESLRRWGVPPDAVVLVEGWFSDTATPETRTRHRIERASVVMIDCDLYSSTKQALAFCAPLIHRQAVFVFDDWNAGELADRRLGEAKAFHELLATHPELHAEELHGLNYRDKADPKLFLVTRG